MEEINRIFNKRNWKLSIDNEETVIKDITSLSDVLKKEISVWKNYSIGKLGNIQSFFSALNFKLEQAIINFNNNKNEALLDRELNEIHNSLMMDFYNKVYSNSDKGTKIRSLYSNSENEIEGIADYFNGTFNAHYLRKEYLTGYIKSVFIDNPKLFSNGFEELFLKSKEYNSELKKVSNATIHQSNSFLNELRNQVESIKSSGENIFATHKHRTVEFEKEYKKKFDEILKNYEEKLRISAPAQYWQEMETHYLKKGHRWRNLSFLIGGLTISFISVIFFFYPSHWSPDVFSLQSVKGALLIGIAISTFVYLLRISIKLTLSNYHLAVDAKERLQLSHFYLAMLKEGGLEKEDRNLVLQALFGRADSGLLQGDSGPTLPIDISTLKSFVSK